MFSSPLTPDLSQVLLGSLALALVVAAATDIRRREIDNWLTGGIALAAPAYWLASALGGAEIAWRVGSAFVAFAVLLGLFVLRALGGGDVKLLAALALWFSPTAFLQIIMLMALIGAPLTLACVAKALVGGRGKPGRLGGVYGAASVPIVVPYGVAIAGAGLCLVVAQLDPARTGLFPW